MGNIYLMTTIIDRSIIKKYYELFQENNLNVLFGFLGSGTASSEVLDYLGLDGAEKAVVFSVVEEHTWIATKKGLEKKLKIDAPGGGISFIMPLSSVGGKKALQFLIESEDYQKEEESTLKNTERELIVVIAIVVVCLILLLPKNETYRSIKVFKVEGTVEVSRNSEVLEAYEQMMLKNNDEVSVVLTHCRHFCFLWV